MGMVIFRWQAAILIGRTAIGRTTVDVLRINEQSRVDARMILVAAGRLRAAVSREPLPEVRGRRHLSCTLGVAEHRKGENTRLVLGRAEAALNYAKAAGRDRVVALAQDGKPLTPDPG